MVNFLRLSLAIYFTSLSEVSDRMCSDNGRKYVDFDGIFPNHRTVDALVLPPSDNYLLFVEFKDVKQVRNIKKWLKKRERIQGIWLKGYESNVKLCEYIVDNSPFNYNDYCRLDKRFMLVYDSKEPRQKIHRHFQGKVKRLETIFNEIFVLRCDKFINFLQGHNL